MKIPITSKGCHPERSENIREVRSIRIASGDPPCAQAEKVLHCIAETDFVSEFPRLNNCFPSRTRHSTGGNTFTNLQTYHAEPLA
jgi:hypothetical protein